MDISFIFGPLAGKKYMLWIEHHVYFVQVFPYAALQACLDEICEASRLTRRKASEDLEPRKKKKKLCYYQYYNKRVVCVIAQLVINYEVDITSLNISFV
jgi:hypothetical protein